MSVLVRPPSSELNPRYVPPGSRQIDRSMVLGFALVGFAMIVSPLGPAAAIAGLLAALVGVGFVGRRLYAMLQLSRSWGDRYSDADAHLRANELAAATAILDPLCEEARSHGALHALTVQARAVVERRRGELDRALLMIDGVLQSGWLQAKQSGLHSQLPAALADSALLHALTGDFDEALVRLERAAAETSRVRRAALVLASAVLAARTGDHEGALSEIERHGRRAAGLLAPPDHRALSVVEAYCLEHTGSDPGYRGEATDRDVGRALGGAYPFEPGEYDYLGTHWPEMADFLRAHRLSPT